MNEDNANKSPDTLPDNCSAKEANFRTPKLTQVKTYREKSNEITNNISVETMKPVSADRITVASLSDTHRTIENQLVNNVKHSGMVYQDGALHSPLHVNRDTANNCSAKMVNFGTPNKITISTRQTAHSTVNSQQSAVNSQQSADSNQHSADSTLSNQHSADSTISSQQSAVSSQHSADSNLQSTVHSWQSAVISQQSAVSSQQSVVSSVQSAISS